MDIEILRTFRKLAEVKNIMKAADELYISQSSVINRIKVLEKEIGHKLFRRSGRGMMLTPQGQHMIRYVEKTLDTLDSGKRELKNLRLAAGQIKIAAAATPASYLLPRWLARFRGDYPFVEIHLHTSYTTSIIESVINGQVEIGFVKGTVKHTGLDCVSVSLDPIVLAVHPDHRWSGRKNVCPADFADEAVLPLNRQTLNWSKIMEWLGPYHNQTNIGMEFDHVETIKQMVLQNFGVAFVPFSSIEDDVLHGRFTVVDVEPPLGLNRETIMISNRKKPLSIHAKIFWNHIREQSQR